HLSEAGNDVAPQQVSVEVLGRRRELWRFGREPPVCPFLQPDIAKPRVLPIASTHVGLGRREPSLRVALGGERFGCADAIAGRVPVPGLPPSRREATGRSEPASCCHWWASRCVESSRPRERRSPRALASYAEGVTVIVRLPSGGGCIRASPRSRRGRSG